ncbi:MAG TPA: hypothetical protein VEA69_04135 [Tepidisphaeraceae bacterium]|nr:hypothetical protein [Tepidisphaeraceae bacterium]
MGIDWYRIKFREDADRVVLRELIEREAMAFQSFNGWHTPFADDRLRDQLNTQLHAAAWGHASDGLQELLVFPSPEEREMDDPSPADPAPMLARRMRLAVVGQNKIFPPLWRLRAYRTFLPEEVRPQLVQWQEWLKAISWGGHEAYVRELWAMHNAGNIREHWSWLRDAALTAEQSDAELSRGDGRPELIGQILRLSEPRIPRFRADPAIPRGWEHSQIEEQMANLIDLARTLVDLTRAWNRGLRSSKRVPFHAAHYQLDFDAFVADADDPWLDEFFGWAEACAAQGFGLMLDP